MASAGVHDLEEPDASYNTDSMTSGTLDLGLTAHWSVRSTATISAPASPSGLGCGKCSIGLSIFHDDGLDARSPATERCGDDDFRTATADRRGFRGGGLFTPARHTEGLRALTSVEHLRKHQEEIDMLIGWHPREPSEHLGGLVCSKHDGRRSRSRVARAAPAEERRPARARRRVDFDGRT